MPVAPLAQGIPALERTAAQKFPPEQFKMRGMHRRLRVRLL
jgi:hypothetical protein